MKPFAFQTISVLFAVFLAFASLGCVTSGNLPDGDAGDASAEDASADAGTDASQDVIADAPADAVSEMSGIADAKPDVVPVPKVIDLVPLHDTSEKEVPFGEEGTYRAIDLRVEKASPEKAAASKITVTYLGGVSTVADVIDIQLSKTKDGPAFATKGLESMSETGEVVFLLPAYELTEPISYLFVFIHIKPGENSLGHVYGVEMREGGFVASGWGVKGLPIQSAPFRVGAKK